MSVKIYNTLIRKKEEFKPLDGKKVGIYVCGPTGYDYSHLGHARAYTAFDIIVRYLRYKGYDVTYIQNITDVDDKIIKRARKNGKPEVEIADKFTEEFFADMDALGIERPDVSPKVTRHIPEIIKVIEGIIKNGMAYESRGDVYFDIRKAKEYGKLSGQSLEELEAGARVEPHENKRYPLDFALWKRTSEGITWDSPWGKGRPGWHIECSAMSMKYLGEQLDIHGGGMDLIFPHHENEILQSEAYTGKKFSNYWMHNGFVMVDNEKMSKSLGNFFVIRDILKKYDAESVRFFLLSTHYRSPIDFTDKQLEQARASLERLYDTIERVKAISVDTSDNDAKDEEIEQIKARFFAAMDNDINTAEAIAAAFELAKLANSRELTERSAERILSVFEEFSEVLNILKKEKKTVEHKIELKISDKVRVLLVKGSIVLSSELKVEIEKREQAREKRDWKEADKIREDLKEKGILLEDRKDGVIVKKLVN